jgi:hypothetical protein
MRRFSLALFAALALASFASANDAIDAVNAQRAARGLPPFVEDPALTQAAVAAAQYRADRLMAQHTTNDFVFLPAGTACNTAGCGASNPGDGFRACCTEEAWTHAGAASVRGRDGRLYHHIFVANRTTTQTVTTTTTMTGAMQTPASCGGDSAAPRGHRRLFRRRQRSC